MSEKLFATGLVLAALAALGSAQAPPIVGYALTDENDLMRMDFTQVYTPPKLTGGAILGLGSQDLVGIDFRPSDKQLYGLGNYGDVFRIDTTTRQATLVASVGVQLQGSRFGIDFNPVTDRLQIASESRQSLTVNVDTGATVVNPELRDTVADYPGSLEPAITGLAYTNSVRGATSTTLYGLSSFQGQNGGSALYRLNTATGVLDYAGAVEEGTGALSGFDIQGDYGYAFTNSTTYGPAFALYTVDLTSANPYLTRQTVVGGNDTFDGFAIAPVPEPATMAAMAVGLGFLSRRRRR